MVEYKLEVTTGNRLHAGTWNEVFVTLIGSKGQSDRTELDNYGPDFRCGTTGTYTVKTSSSLGKLLLVKVEKVKLMIEDEWYCTTVVVTTPEGDVILFPCHRWISSEKAVELRGGKATKVFEEDHPLLVDHRKKELTLKKSTFRWNILVEGLPHISNFENKYDLPDELCFSNSKSSEEFLSFIKIRLEFNIKKKLTGSKEQWENFEDMKMCHKKTKMSEYVTEHWKEDAFYGSQFLNAVNPNVIKRCLEIPPNFPVTEEMVKPFLEEGSSLQKEMKKGKIFLYDQKKMDGIEGRDYNGKRLHVTAGLCLFYLNRENNLMPIAIQLHQQPSEQNPIFLPSDLETDWLLAKMFIRNADFIDHEAVHHLMKTHFLAEAFTVATLRNFPVIHPLYRLLTPHFRHTLYINTGGRKILLDDPGILCQSSLGKEEIIELMRRAHSETTYSSLCLPDNITARGLETIPNFYYRDDGLKLWNIINGFVRAVVKHYYLSDSEVLKDTELQEWISEIFTRCFLGNKASGFPERFNTTEEVIRFITMVIFTVTVQHAAVNHGQYDYYSWVPNGSLLLRKPPPTTKGQTDMQMVLETLPNVDETISFVAVIWVLSEKYTDFVPLGRYPEERFYEPALKQMIKTFQAELSDLSEEITKRNSRLVVPYEYLNPKLIENSITV